MKNYSGPATHHYLGMYRLTILVFKTPPRFNGLSVFLFTLLRTFGLGCMCSTRINQMGKPTFAILLIPILFSTFFFYYQQLMDYFESGAVIIRIAAVSVMLIPIGLFMGIALPLSIKLQTTMILEH